MATMDERRPVTILFTDIVGSTALAEKLDPEEWKEIVNGAHQRVSDAVTRYEGTVAQLLGDGVLAFFGAPHAHEDDPARAVRAGLDIQRAIADYERELRGYVDAFQMRVGINSGLVVAGAVGSAEHSEYLVVGDAVNLAARLQSAAQPGSVLISESIARVVKHLFELDDLGEITVKGKTEPIHIYQVQAYKALPSSGRGIEGLTSPLVGREREVMQLREALSELRGGQGQIVFVLGEAGIGKSRLVEEARSADSRWQIADSQSVTKSHQPFAIRWLEGRTLSYGQSLPFWLITQLIQNDLGLADGEPEVRVKIALRRRVKELFGDKSDESLPYLAHLLGVKFEGETAERIKGLDGETLKRQVLISIVDYATKLAQQQPTVFVFEDVHWADPSSLEALERLLRVTERAPLMIVALMRAETDKPAWRLRELAAREYRRRFRELELEPLTADDSRALVENLLNIAALPEALRSLIQERAEGNPFYLEEIVRSLIEQGAIVQSDNRWVATQDIASIAIPETLQALLLTRIDHLEEEVKRTLQLASVIGRSFLFTLLEAISQAERELDWHLAQLQRADLVREKARMPELEYIFKHALTQEAAYDSLLLERRREFHRKVGTALEELFADRQDEFLGLLAYHFDRAGEREKALYYLLRAGDKTRRQDAQEEAVQFYKRAQELLHEQGDAEGEARTWLKLGLIYHANFEFEKAHAANERAFALQQEASHQSGKESKPADAESLKTLVWLVSLDPVPALDPTKMRWTEEVWVHSNLFAGLIERDAEFNVIPAVARSWQVQDEGTRYVFHLRDDVYWTDGTPVTAADFEWAWKRNLMPRLGSTTDLLLDCVKGARSFREGKNPDPDSIAVKALDAHTLEVRLEGPVAFFPFILAQPITFPLPRATVERYGDAWCKAPHIVSNGAFRLVEANDTSARLERNPGYFGRFEGNVGSVEFRYNREGQEGWDKFLSGEGDAVYFPTLAPGELSQGKRLGNDQNLGVLFLSINTALAPMDDVRVRRALAHALDLEALARLGDRVPARGGMVHPHVPGHSPGLNLGFDPAEARRLLAEAGYPDGEGVPLLILENPTMASEITMQELARQWRDTLNIRIEVPNTGRRYVALESATSHLAAHGWQGDYPDPDAFLRELLPYYVWLTHDALGARYTQLVEDAVHVRDRVQRMAMYREADRILVAERVLVIPLDNAGKAWNHILRPWVTVPAPSDYMPLKQVRIEPH